MDIVVIGAGSIGYTLSVRLSEEGHNVTVIDSDEERLAYVSNTVDAMAVAGNGSDYKVQTAAGVPDADVLISVTDDDATNMLCCLIGKKLGAKYSVARVRTVEYYTQMVFLKDELGLSMVINPEQATAAEISRVLRFPSAAKVASFAKGKAEMVEMTVPASAKIDGLRLTKLHDRFGSRILICAVERNGEVVIPKGDFTLAEGDVAQVVGSPQAMSAFFKELGIYKRGVRSVTLLGAGRLSVYLSQELLSTGIRVKILEKNPDHCAIIKELSPKAEVICGDGSLPNVLTEEGIQSTDAFVALTGSDQNNLVTSMFAARSGAGKVITKFSNESFRSMVDSKLLSSIVIPQNIAADQIVQYVRAIQNSYAASGIQSLHEIANGRAETLEFAITAERSYLGKPLKSLKIRSDTLLAAIIRGNTCIIPNGNDSIMFDDNVIAVTTKFGMQTFDDIFED